VFLLPEESKSDIEKLEYFRAIIRSKYLPKNSNNRSTYQSKTPKTEISKNNIKASRHK
jgi:hypothetical protein